MCHVCTLRCHLIHDEAIAAIPSSVKLAFNWAFASPLLRYSKLGLSWRAPCSGVRWSSPEMKKKIKGTYVMYELHNPWQQDHWQHNAQCVEWNPELGPFTTPSHFR